MKLEYLGAGLLAAVAIAGVGWQIYQEQRLTLPDYDNSLAPYKPPAITAQPTSFTANLINVVDGDTITIGVNNQHQTVRLCGIDAPQPAQPLGTQSGEMLRQLISKAGNQVIVYQIGRDRNGRIVGEVFVKAPTTQQPEQELLLNYEQVTRGAAYVYPKYVNQCLSKESLLQAETEAKQTNRGVWSNPQAVKPWDFRNQ